METEENKPEESSDAVEVLMAGRNLTLSLKFEKHLLLAQNVKTLLDGEHFGAAAILADQLYNGLVDFSGEFVETPLPDIIDKVAPVSTGVHTEAPTEAVAAAEPPEINADDAEDNIVTEDAEPVEEVPNAGIEEPKA